MRNVLKVSLIAATLLATANAAVAYDTFIPLGKGYSTNNLDSAQITADEQAAINQADIYETELYMKHLREKQFDSRLNKFMFDRQSNGAEDQIDY